MSALDELTTLLITCPPPFVYIHDPFKNTASTLISSLSLLHAKSPLAIAIIDAIVSFTPRILFDSALNQLADWTPEWNAGCLNWSGTDLGGGDGRWNENIDGFTHGLRAVMEDLKKKDKSRIVLVIKNVDKMSESSWAAAFTRLHELAQIPITTVFIGAVSWLDLRSQMDGWADPYYLALEPPTESATLHILQTNFITICESESHPAYASHLLPLYKNFIQTLYAILSPYTSDPIELAYISAARWPGFVAPLTSEKPSARGGTISGKNGLNTALSDEKRMKMIKEFSSSFKDAVEQLYPRKMHAMQWAKSQELKEKEGKSKTALVNGHGAIDLGEGPRLTTSLTVLAKFILVASFLASVNPSKSDVTLFMRFGDGGHKRRRGGGKPRGGGPAKVSQRLLGPGTFPIDRLLAIVGSLLEEHDTDSNNRQPIAHLANDGLGIGDERSEIDVQRVAIFAEIQELIALRLLHRMSRVEVTDLGGHVILKSAVPEEHIRRIAPQILSGVSIDDLIWDSNR